MGTTISGSERSSYALLADGTTIEIRQAIPADLETVRRFNASMSAGNLYPRFFGVSRRTAEQDARRVCRPPDEEHAALLAWLGDRLAGVASFEPAGAGVAEVAFAVADDLHGRSIATLLLEHLVSMGRSRHLEAFCAQTLPGNAAMLRVFADAGPDVRRRLNDGVVEVTLPVPRAAALTEADTYLDAVARRESAADVESLRPLFRPASLVVVGASRSPGTVGRAILRDIISGGYTGRVYADNPHAPGELEGVRCLPAVAALLEPCDLAVIAVPPAAVPRVAEECGVRGVRAIVVITSAVGPREGTELLAACRRYGMRLVGPNCFGVVVPGLGLDATFAASHAAPGVAGLVPQSGGLGFALLSHLSRIGVGVSSFVSLGNKYDVSGNDLLTWWDRDGATRLAVLYLESFGNPRKFARSARRLGRTLPVLTLSAGRTEVGLRAAASHTAAVATPLLSRRALFQQAGIIATESLGELLLPPVLIPPQRRQRRRRGNCPPTPIPRARPGPSGTLPATPPGVPVRPPPPPTCRACGAAMPEHWSRRSWPACPEAAGCRPSRSAHCSPATGYRWSPPGRSPTWTRLSPRQANWANAWCSRRMSLGSCTRPMLGR